MPRAPDKWTAFLLSLAVPGVGQLWAGSATCVVWFLAAGLVASAWLVLAEGAATGPLLAGQFVSLAALGICSAEHAKRLLEPAAADRRPAIRSHVWIARRSGRSIDIRMELDLPYSVANAWRRISDLNEFLTIDPFHERVVPMRAQPAAGVDLVLWHNAFGRRFARFGRILAWREGRGYTFSDLSPRGPRHGFPHVFAVQLEPLAVSGDRTRLTIAVRGKWTSPVAPAAVGRFWIWLVCREHARLLRKAL